MGGQGKQVRAGDVQPGRASVPPLFGGTSSQAAPESGPPSAGGKLHEQLACKYGASYRSCTTAAATVGAP